MGYLKKFQENTVDAVVNLYHNNHNRILVADEVGMGKTMIARAVIKRLSQQKEKTENEPFRTIYLCSNQNIIQQNMEKLNIENKIFSERLSMQGINLYQPSIMEEHKSQVFPITIGTSIVTRGEGQAEERAYIYCVLSSIFDKSEELSSDFYKKGIMEILKGRIGKKWGSNRPDLSKEEKANIEKEGLERFKGIIDWKKREWNFEEMEKLPEFQKFLKAIQEKIEEEKMNGHSLKEEIVENCEKEQGNHNREIISKLRKIFVEVTLEKLQPDLIIMDEFQRFKKEIIESEKDSETDMVVEKLLKQAGKEVSEEKINREERRNQDFVHEKEKKTKVLLLSATPYKFYSTIEEIEINKSDEAYQEFFEVVRFLLDSNQIKEFERDWKLYSDLLLKGELDDSLKKAKQKVEETLRTIICRTERNSNVREEQTTPIKISKKDAKTYFQAEKAFKSLPAFKGSMRIEFAKSCPYPLSFMDNYEIKRSLERYFTKVDNRDKLNNLNQDLLWVDPEKVSHYKEIEGNNAKLEKLKTEVFSNNIEKLLWLPPTKPYYAFENVFQGAEGITKTLVFSAWTMVPRMLSNLLSYEEERRRIVELQRQEDERSKTITYQNYSELRTSELGFNLKEGMQYSSMRLFSLLYPSIILEDTFKPYQYLNKKIADLKQIEHEIGKELKEKLVILQEKYRRNEEENRNEKIDNRWYYIAPLLLDEEEKRGSVESWLEGYLEISKPKKRTGEEQDFSALVEYLGKLKEEFCKIKQGEFKLGKMPEDLEKQLTKLSIASPAICAYRSFKNVLKEMQQVIEKNPLQDEKDIPKEWKEDARVYASKFGKLVFNLFNSPEAASILRANYKKKDGKKYRNYAERVLQYCEDGNFQAMLDEYVYLLSENISIAGEVNGEEIKKVIEKIVFKISEAMGLQTSVEMVDTYPAFQNRVKNKEVTALRMRSHFATGFYQTKNDQNVTNRKENIRSAFNSPFRPFVLATTSIGQEGLDFHYYCRKVVHWNLPSNPIDIEQREGRVNRYKCLAIRKYWAKWSTEKEITYTTNSIWKEIFDAALQEKDVKELVPYWCVPNEEQLEIERLFFLYEYSKDIGKYERMKEILRIYKIALGQQKQEELLEKLSKKIKEKAIKEAEIKGFFIDLSPNGNKS